MMATTKINNVTCSQKQFDFYYQLCSLAETGRDITQSKLEHSLKGVPPQDLKRRFFKIVRFMRLILVDDPKFFETLPRTCFYSFRSIFWSMEKALRPNHVVYNYARMKVFTALDKADVYFKLAIPGDAPNRSPIRQKRVVLPPDVDSSSDEKLFDETFPLLLEEIHLTEKQLDKISSSPTSTYRPLAISNQCDHIVRKPTQKFPESARALFQEAHSEGLFNLLSEESANEAVDSINNLSRVLDDKIPEKKVFVQLSENLDFLVKTIKSKDKETIERDIKFITDEFKKNIGIEDARERVKNDVKNIALLGALVASVINFAYRRDKKSAVLVALASGGVLIFATDTNNQTILQYLATIGGIIPTFILSNNNDETEEDMEISMDEVPLDVSESFAEMDDLVNGALTLFTGYITCTSGKSIPTELFKSLGNWGRMKQSLTSILDFLSRMVEKLVNWARNNIFGLPSMRLLDSGHEELEQYFDANAALYERNRLGTFYRDESNLMQIETQIQLGKTFVKKIPRDKLSDGLLRLVENDMRQLSNLKKDFEACNITLSGSRQEATVILFRGGAGVGKSIMMEHLHYALSATILDDDQYEAFQRNPNTFVYNRQTENVYWDGYNSNSLVTYFDDFGQIRDQPGVGATEYMELIRAANSFEYSLHMANIEGKGNAKFASKFILASTNMKTFEPESINCKAALNRRFDLQYVVVPKKQYAKQKEGVANSYYNTEFDPAKLPQTEVEIEAGANPSQKHRITNLTPYLVDLFPVNHLGEVVGEAIGFEDLVRNAISIYHKKRIWHISQKKDFAETAQRYRTFFQEESEMRTEMNMRLADDLDREFLRTLEQGRSLPNYLPDNEFLSYAGTDALRLTNRYPRPIRDGVTDIMAHIEDVRTSYDDYTFRTGFLERVMAFIFSGYPESDRSYNVVMALPMEVQISVALQTFGSTFYRMVMQNEGDYAELWYEFHNSTRSFNRTHRVLQVPDDIEPGNPIYDDLRPFYNEWRGTWNRIVGSCRGGYVWLRIKTFLGDSYGSVTNTASEVYAHHPGIISAGAGFAATAALLTGLMVTFKYVHSNKSKKKKKNNSSLPDAVLVTEQTPADAESFGWSDKLRVGKKNKTYVRDAKSVKNLISKAAKSQGSDSLDPTGSDLYEKICRKSVFEFSIEDASHPGNYISAGFVIAVRGRVILVPYHFIYNLISLVEQDISRTNLKVRISRDRGKERLVDYKFTVAQILDGYISGKLAQNDLCLVKLPDTFQVCSDRVKNFAKREDFQHVKKNIPFLMTLPRADFKTFTGVANPTDRVLRMETEEAGEYFVRSSYVYSAFTSPGDCGAPFCVLNTKLTDRKIFGVHTAGNKTLGESYSAAVCQEDILEDLNILGDVPFSEDTDHLELTTEVVSEGQFTVLGTTKLKNSVVLKTEIIPSRVNGCYKHPESKPVHLRPFVNLEGDRIDPMEKALLKFGFEMATPRAEHIVGLKDDFLYWYNDVCKVNVHKRKLTVREAIFGIASEEHSGSVPSDTSAGYPFCVQGVRNIKKELFATEEGSDARETILQEIEEDIGTIIESYKKGVRPLWICTVNRKDERKEEEKVNEGKMRLFMGCNFYYNIIYRMYNGTFHMHFLLNRINNGSAVGSNATGPEWDTIAKRLSQFDDTFDAPTKGAGDFSSFDGREQPLFHNIIRDVINDWYGGSLEDRCVRNLLWLEVTNSRHILDGVVFEMVSSLSSGHPATITINCIYNLLAFRYSWSVLTNRRDLFNSCVFVIVVGDDNTFTVRHDFREVFNEMTIGAPMLELGLVYTTELKEKAKVPFRRLTEVDFLKRAFRLNPFNNQWIAPLRLSVILEIPMWTKRTSDRVEIAASNMITALQELSLHPREVYDEWSPKMINCFRHRYPDVQTYEPLEMRYEVRQANTLKSQHWIQ